MGELLEEIAAVVLKMDIPFPCLCLLGFVLMIQLTAAESVKNKENQLKSSIGAIVNDNSRIGKEEKVAMAMAMEDFNHYNNQSLVLHVRKSQRNPLRAAVAAMDLIKKHGAQAILGPQTWEEVSLVADIGSQNHVPVLSLADMTPSWATEKWSFLIAASADQYAQVKAVASIVQFYEWDQVTIIYEDFYVSVSEVIHLSDALREKGIEVHHVAFPPFNSQWISKELKKLKKEQCRVFVVHLSSSSAVDLFARAKRMKMMEKEFVWITTTTFTNLIHSVSPSIIASTMQGIIGIKSYISYNASHLPDFHLRFRRRFSLEHPEESNHEPGIYAVQAYDALLMLAQAISKGKEGKLKLENILHSNYSGLCGKVHFINKTVAPTQIFQIINIVGRSYRELGFWSIRAGFLENIDDISNQNLSVKNLGQVFWPGGCSNTPRGWKLPTNAKPLRIGVPTRSIFKTYVNIQYDQMNNETSITGLAIELFNKIVKHLLFPLPYTLIPFHGTYDELVMQIELKNFDAVVGDTAIISSQHKYAEFTQPFTERGLVMIVPLQLKTSNRAWLFMKPYTKAMWCLIGFISIYNGFVVWLIERHHRSYLNGSALNQTGSLLWLSFSTLFSFYGERLHSNLSRMTMVVWLFVALVLSQIYTTNLASILTTQAGEPTVADIMSLQNTNAMIGHTQASFVKNYLVSILHFNPQNMKNYTSPEALANDLINGKVAAIFLEVPVAKLFLARYCKSFTLAGPTYKVGGYGFVFPKGSPLLHSVNEALLNVSESGKLKELENSMIVSQNCTEVDHMNHDISSLGPDSFWGLFLLTGSISTVALIIYVGHCLWERKANHSLFVYCRFDWSPMLAVSRTWNVTRTRLFSRNVTKTEERLPKASENENF